MGQKSQYLAKKANFWPNLAILTQKFEYLGPKVIFLYGNRDFCQQGISQVYPGLQLSHSDHSKKNINFRARGHFSGLTPVFGLVEPSGPSKK